MLNWLFSGVIDFGGYLSPVLFLLYVLVWFLFVRKLTDIKKNRKILVKVGIVSLIGAAISPLLIILFTGNLFPFFSSSWKIIQKIDSFASFKTVLGVAFKGFSITGGILILSIVLLFVVNGAKKLTFAILFPFPLFAALARISCFLKGCCFGKLYNGIFAISYPPASLVSRQQYAHSLLPSRYVKSLPVHPTQLYIIFSMLLLFIGVAIMNRLGIKKNIISGTVLAGYGFFNFFIEFSREEQIVFKFLTMGQIMEIILMFLGFYLMFKVKEEEVFENK